ncbi:SLAIN motif-containing protein 1-like [Micropterus dolomieu]|uniref:SLAIN motif-containing protein 1-like n=1 Tax=Micropterus dolomieu TaxID=147949 RepID=UPI001E8DFF52|nr:SLAIN motif-containing protein 1-like [Micropterus dolomieu]
MEAAVLNLAMMTEVDCNSNTLNAELEVKKLQELVRKLERQNEQLRTRASGCNGGPHVLPASPAYVLGSVGGYCLPSPLPTLLCQSSLGSLTPPEEPFDYFLPHIDGDGAASAGEAEDGSEPSVLDELELLDLNSLSCSDEPDDTWLYSSSKASDSTDNSLTPLQWCRQALDTPKSEVEAARRSLSLRLEQAPPKIIALFKLLYSNAQSCVRINGRDSDWFPISSSVRQGCVAAPDLFNCIIDHLMSRVCERVPGVAFGSYYLTDLEYADDTILLSTSLSQLRGALGIYIEEAEKLGLQVSWTKTKFMYVGDGPYPIPLRFGNDTVEPVSSFVYLGSLVTNNGDLKPEITRRRALAASALQSLWKPLWRHHTISRRMKLRIYNLAVLPILLYGSETWPLNKTLAARLDGFDSRALRTIENIRWPQRVSNQVLRAHIELQAGNDHEVNPAPDGSTSSRVTSNNTELLWTMQSSWLKIVSTGNNWFIWSAQRTRMGRLRQDYASTSSILASRRSQSFTFQLSQLSAGPDLEEEDEEDDEDYGLLPPPQPRLTRLPHSHTFSSIRDWRRSTSSLSTPPSTPSTPPYLSAGFAFQHQPQGLGLGSPCAAEQQGFRPGSAEYENKLRRSMPNLVRAPSMPSVPIPTNPSASHSLLRNSQSFDSSSGLARLHSSIPSPGQLQNRVHSVGNFASLSRQPLKATAYVSPTIKGSPSMPTSNSLQSLNSGDNNGVGSGIPLPSKPAGGGGMPTSTPNTPRSSLPRPASFVGTTSSTPRSKVAQPARSLLTPPKSLSTLSALRDSNWRDGCY